MNRPKNFRRIQEELTAIEEVEKERGVKEGLTSQVVNESIASRKAAAVEEAAWQPMTFLPPVLMLDAIPCDLQSLLLRKWMRSCQPLSCKGGPIS